MPSCLIPPLYWLLLLIMKVKGTMLISFSNGLFSPTSSPFLLATRNVLSSGPTSITSTEKDQDHAFATAIRIRGGASAASMKSIPFEALHAYTAVSTVIWGDTTKERVSLFPPGCQLLGESFHWVGHGSWLNESKPLGGNTPVLWKTLSFLSDIFVLVLNTRDPIDLDLVSSLESGFQSRLPDFPKGRLLIVLNERNLSKHDMKTWKTRLSSTLEGSAPNIVEELEIVPPVDYEPTLLRMLQHVSQINGGVCRLADAETFPSLVKQVHHTFGGEVDSLLTSDESVFRHEKKKQRLLAPGRVSGGSSSDNIVTTLNSSSLSSPPPPPPPPPAAAAAAAFSQPETVRMKSNVVTTPSIDDVDFANALVARADELLDDLQFAQERLWIDADRKKGKRFVDPINFPSKVGLVLIQVEKELRGMHASLGTSDYVISYVRRRIQLLYQHQVEYLRDYFGKLYESALEKTSRKCWKDAATKTSERFRETAEKAVPSLSRQGKTFEDNDLNYFRSMAESGLISDMMEATSLRQNIALEDAMDDFSDGENNLIDNERYESRRLALWYEKIAARALVIGVNYIQGWLAWQGIKRAALLREQQMPKFPLF